MNESNSGERPNRSPHGRFPVVRPADVIDIRGLWLAFRRRQGLFFAVAAFFLVAVVLITFQLTPQYTAHAQVMLDMRQRQVVDLEAVVSGLPPDSAVVDTEVEILRSRALANRVVDELGLMNDPEFNPVLRDSEGMAAWLENTAAHMQAIFSAALPEDQAARAGSEQADDRHHAVVVQNLLKAISAKRQGLTFVIDVAATSASPEKAMTIANAFADKYLVEQLEAKFEATRAANIWLEARLTDLRQEVNAKEQAVETYRAQAGLLNAGGESLTEQQTSDLNAQIVIQRADLAEKQARLRGVQNLVSAGGSNQEISEALTSDVIRELRSQKAEVVRRQAELSSRYGERHPEMLKVRRELADIETEIEREAERIVTSLKNEVDVARQRVASLETSIKRLRGEMVENNSDLVRLRELQREAEASRTLYESFLTRFRQTSEQQTLQEADARIISGATAPARPSSPDLLLNFMLGLAFAGVAGGAAVFVAETFDQGLATKQDIERELGIASLAMIPTVPGKYAAKGNAAQYVLDKPLSSYAESLRSLRASILFGRSHQDVHVVALTSAVPREGKTSTTLALGRVSAKLGSRTLVIDADIRRSMLTQVAGLTPEVGLLEVLEGRADLDDAIFRDAESGLDILPLTGHDRSASDVFGREAMKNLLKRLRERYELILLDTAPAMAVAETRILSTAVDSVVLLLRWRKTPRNVVKAALDTLEQVDAPVTGAALTQVNLRAEGRYGAGGGYGGSYYKYYSKYYQD